MRYVLAVILGAASSQGVLLAQVPPEGDLPFQRLIANTEADNGLFAFCLGARLYDRGLTSSPLAGTTDSWIVQHLITSKRFLRAVDEIQAASEFVGAEDLSPDRRNKSAPDDVVAHYQRFDASSEKLSQALTAEQRKKLPAVYLHAEGLLALCRPEFAAVFEKQESQNRIREMANEMWSKEAARLHRALFGLQSLDLAPVIQIELRDVAFRLDCQIVDVLTKTERQRLWGFLSKTHPLRHVTHGAPAY